MFLILRKIYNKYSDINYDESESTKETENPLTLEYNIIKSCILFIIIFFIKKKKKNPQLRIEIDNILKENIYENNIDFSHYSSTIKPIAMYFPKNENSNNISLLSKIMNKNILLAKSHGIYGFAIYYNYASGINIYDNYIDIILEKENSNFTFLLILNNIISENLVDKKYIEKSVEFQIDILIKKIKKYLLSNMYIKIDNKPVLSINNPFQYNNVSEILLLIRQKASENGVGEIYILYPIKNRLKNLKYQKFFDGAYDYYINNNTLKERQNSYNMTFYSELIYQNLFYNEICDRLTIYRTSVVENNNNLTQFRLKYYSPEKYYILNKIIIQWTTNNYDINKRFIFINSWNNYEEGNYLEPDDKFGYASLNSLSKALFDLPYNKNNYKIKYYNNSCIIAIQAHVFYEDLIHEIVNKTNNIPIKFDLYITTITNQKKNIIERYVQKYSKANKYEVQIVENKGRDVLPFITQMRNIIKNYKYVCHIHTKKSKHDPSLGDRWRNYLYNNLLGSEELITQIISEFENFKKLGIVFPDVYSEIIKDINHYDKTNFFLHKPNINYMRYILIRIFPTAKIGKKLIFPSGDMFWARVDAIYQIFEVGILDKFPRELNQTNITIMHAIERIWVYLAKLNGFDYKMIFKYY